MKINKYPIVNEFGHKTGSGFWYVCNECGWQMKRTLHGLKHPTSVLLIFRSKCPHAGKTIQDPEPQEVLDLPIVSNA